MTRQPETHAPILEGWTSRQGIGVVASEKISLFVNLAAYERGGKRMGVFVLTSSTDLYKQYADTEVSVVTATLRARAGGEAKKAQDKPDKAIQPAAKKDAGPFVSDKGRVNRVVEIGVPAARPEIRCDYAAHRGRATQRIHHLGCRPQGSWSSVPAVPPDLASTRAIYRAYASLFRRGDSVKLSDLCAGLDLFVKRMRIAGSTQDAVTQWIRSDIFSPNPSKRTFANFIHALSLEHGNAGATFGGPNEWLDPAQTLLVVRRGH